MSQSLASLLRRLNPVLRGWASFYRHCYGASSVFNRLDWYVWNIETPWLTELLNPPLVGVKYEADAAPAPRINRERGAAGKQTAENQDQSSHDQEIAHASFNTVEMVFALPKRKDHLITDVPRWRRRRRGRWPLKEDVGT